MEKPPAAARETNPQIRQLQSAVEQHFFAADRLIDRAFLETIIEQMPCGVIIAEAPSGRIISSNPQVEKILRRPLVEMYEIDDYGQYEGYDLAGRRYQSQDWPLARSLRTGEVVQDEEIAVRLADDSFGILQVNAAPIRAQDGRILGGVVVMLDVTERRREQQERSELLAREQVVRAAAEQASDRATRLQLVTAALSRALTPEQVTRVIVEEAVAALGGFAGAVSVLNRETRSLDLLGMFGYDEDAPRRWAAIPLDAPVPMSTAVRDESPIWVSTREEYFRLFPAIRDTTSPRTQAYAAIPLSVDDVLIGALGLSFPEPHVFSTSDQSFILTLAHQCAQALRRAWLYEAEHAARRAAEQAMQLREEFLSTASHELKTPLTTVKAYAQLLLRRLRRPDVDLALIASSAEQIVQHVNKLEALVFDLLDVSQLEQGRLAFRYELVDLVAVARQVIERLEVMPGRRPEHRLVLDADGVLQGWYDPVRIDQALTNLASNAVKYSPNGGEIRIIVRQIGDEAEITVHDQGMGISEVDQPHLFQPFARGRANELGIPGTGLGLFIAKQIVDRHGGSIRVESEQDAGSTFTVRLPLTPPDPDPIPRPSTAGLGR